MNLQREYGALCARENKLRERMQGLQWIRNRLRAVETAKDPKLARSRTALIRQNDAMLRETRSEHSKVVDRLRKLDAAISRVRAHMKQKQRQKIKWAKELERQRRARKAKWLH